MALCRPRHPLTSPRCGTGLPRAYQCLRQGGPTTHPHTRTHSPLSARLVYFCQCFLSPTYVTSLFWSGIVLPCWHGVVMVLARCWHGVGTVLAWCWHGVGMVLSWCWHGVVMVLAWCCHGVGTMLAQRWHGTSQHIETCTHKNCFLKMQNTI